MKKIIYMVLVLCVCFVMYGCRTEKNALSTPSKAVTSSLPKSNSQEQSQSAADRQPLDCHPIPLTRQVLDAAFTMQTSFAPPSGDALAELYQNLLQTSQYRELEGNRYYTVADLESGERLFAFYSREEGLGSFYYSSDLLRQEDFEPLRAGSSTVQDVYAVDACTRIYEQGQIPWRFLMEEPACYSIHMVSGGTVVVSYSSKSPDAAVVFIDFVEDALVAGVDPLDYKTGGGSTQETFAAQFEQPSFVDFASEDFSFEKTIPIQTDANQPLACYQSPLDISSAELIFDFMDVCHSHSGFRDASYLHAYYQLMNPSDRRLLAAYEKDGEGRQFSYTVCQLRGGEKLFVFLDESRGIPDIQWVSMVDPAKPRLRRSDFDGIAMNSSTRKEVAQIDSLCSVHQAMGSMEEMFSLSVSCTPGAYSVHVLEDGLLCIGYLSKDQDAPVSSIGFLNNDAVVQFCQTDVTMGV